MTVVEKLVAVLAAFTTRACVAMLAIAVASRLVPSIAVSQIEVSGTVSDASSNAALAGVTVEASSPALIEQRVTTTTDDHGRYLFRNLRPGLYTFTFRKESSLTSVQADFDLSGVAQEIPARLVSGNIDQTIEVSGKPPGIDTRGVRTTHVIDKQKTASLPVATGILNAGTLLFVGRINASSRSRSIRSRWMSAATLFLTRGAHRHELREPSGGVWMPQSSIHTNAA
jgi:Carboxypeptidase regulatory-like domain